MEQLFLHNSESREVEAVPRSEGRFGVYCCGPTVYNFAHIGNFRTFIGVDLLVRVLQCAGYEPVLVRNITDIDDKIIAGAKNSSQSLEEFTDHWTDIFHEDCGALNLRPPAAEPRATEHIPLQIVLIKRLLEQHVAYERQGSVYFRPSAWERYGRLSRLRDRELQAGASPHRGQILGEDFALWKAVEDGSGEVAYPSPWGRGRPGWHIECSAMALHYLGTDLAIHCGGMDLCFPHHENEMAQAEAATGHVFARHWFHVAHLCVGGEKMAKSLGNLFTLHDILAMGYSPMALRYALLCGHYRQPLNFTIPSLRSAERALERLRHRGALLRERAGNGKCRADGFRIFAPSWQCLLRDLHTPDALGQLFLHLQRSDVAHMGKEEAEREWAEWQRLMEVLGLDLEPNPPSPVPDAIGRIAEERLAARAGKDYAKADELRREMESEGWTVRDTANGYALEKFANHTE